MKLTHRLIEKIVNSLYYKRLFILRFKAKSPDDRIFIEDLYAKRKKIVSSEMDQEVNAIRKLKDSYEYKIYEHNKMFEFYQKNNLSSDFVKFCKFEQLERKDMWASKYFPIFIPLFVTHRDFSWNKFKIILLLFTGIISFKIGFHNGIKDSAL